MYVVSTKANDTNEVVVRTLIGEYTESGSNHGRKVFKKLPNQGPEVVDVFLYYWDSRDGPTFEGWWFGNKLGGTQVWSHCASAAMSPPSSGWKIPWDGAPRPTLCVDSKAKLAAAADQEKIGAVSRMVSETGTASKAALDQARVRHQNYTSLAGLQAAEELLAPHVQGLAEALNKVVSEQRTAQGDTARQLAALGTAVRAAQSQVAGELAKVRGAKLKAEQDTKSRAAEARDRKAFQDMLPECQEKANNAEDAVEKALITSEMIQAAGDQEEEALKAVEETDAAYRTAQEAISVTRIFLNQKQVAIRRFETASVRDASVQELSKLHGVLLQAQNKLNPLKTAKQDFEMRGVAQKLVAEVMEKLTPAEMECDKAEEATVLLTEEGPPTKESMAAADMAVTQASAALQAVLRMLNARKATAQGIVLKEINQLEERVRNSEKRVQQLKVNQKEATEKTCCELMLKEATDKLTAVQEAVAKVSNAEGPFLMGVEELPLEETLAAVKACETTATSANTAVSIARMFIATKLVEAKRFSAAVSAEATTRLKELQQQMEVHSKKLSSIKTNTATRKKKAFMRESEAQVKEAEAAVKALATAAAVFEDSAKLSTLSSQEITQASEDTAKAEFAALSKLTEARKFVHARQLEAKGREGAAEVGAELVKYNARISQAQADVAKYKKLAASFGERLQAVKAAEEGRAKVDALETKVTETVGKVEAFEAPAEGAAEITADDMQEAEARLGECSGELRRLHGHLASVASRNAAAQEDFRKLQERIAGLQGKLAATQGKLRARGEQAEVRKHVQEADQKLKQAEEALKAALEAEAPFLTGQEVPPAEAGQIFEALEKAERAAGVSVTGAKTLITTKKLALKRVSEAAAAKVAEDFEAMTERMEKTVKKLADLKASVAGRKHAITKAQVEAKMQEVIELVKAAKEATDALVAGTDLAPEAMKAACEKAGTAQAAAKKAVEDTRIYLQSRQRDSRGLSDELKAELVKMFAAVDEQQAELETQVGKLRDQEHKFVAQRLEQDAEEQLAAVEKRLEEAQATAAPLVSEDTQHFTAFLWLAEVVGALKRHTEATKKTQEAVCAAMVDKGDAVSEAKFLSFLGQLPELREGGDALFSEAELKAVFKHLDSEGKGEVAKAKLLEQFRTKYVVSSPVSMTDGPSVKGGKTIRKLELHEVAEALGEPVKDPNPKLNLTRVHARMEKDGKEGYITLRGNQGTDFLSPYDPYVSFERQVMKAVQELFEAANAAGRYLDRKSGELNGVPGGPLAETRDKLAGLKPRVMQVLEAHSELNGKVARARKAHQESVEAEKQRRQEAIDRRNAKATIEEAEAAAKAASDEAAKASELADKLTESKGADASTPVQAFSDTDKALLAAAESCDKVEETLRGKLDGMRAHFKGPFAEARTAVKALKDGLAAASSKCRKQAAGLKDIFVTMEQEVHGRIVQAMCEHLRKEGSKPDDWFKKLAGGDVFVSPAAFRGYVEKVPGLELKAGQLDVGLSRYSSGVSRLTALCMLQRFVICVKEIAITSGFDIKECKTLRKLAVGEIVEILEEEKTHEASGMVRCLSRALMDGQEGWITIRGNQGTTFMEACSKPFYILDDEAQVQAEFSSTSAELRRTRAGEVMELLEGPRREDSCEVQRARGAGPDGKEGWVTFKDASGTEHFEQVKLFVCRRDIALTPELDITKSKSLRKLEVGEVMDVLGEAQTDKKGLQRIKIKTRRDEEGWVTLKGNQGTAFVEESNQHFVCKVAVALEQRFQSGSPLVRSLEFGDTFELREGPKAETKEGASRLKGRNLSDGTEGWFSGPNAVTVPWNPSYLCKQGTALTEGLEIASQSVRKLEAGERLEALDAPTVEAATGLMRVRVRCERDGASGFATVRSQQGALLLASVAA